MAGQVLVMSTGSLADCARNTGFRQRARVHSKCECQPIRQDREKGSTVQTMQTDGLGCVRGTALMLMLEASAGMCCYGIWQICHFVR